MDSKHAPLLLAGIISLGFFGLMGILSFHSVPPENKDTLEAMLGVLSTSFAGLVGYYFGSSASKGSTLPPVAVAVAAPAVSATPTLDQGEVK